MSKESDNLGNLEKLALRKIWKNEASEFTPWLSENLDRLSDALGFELELVDTEVSAGSFSADILAKDTLNDRYVIIENQLTKTDHNHLGKLITYSAVLDAYAVIWIAPEFTDEHKKALDWLNDHTDDEISFFGVIPELWKIDDSKPAIVFNVISRPNEAVRDLVHRKNLGELSELRKKQLGFWQKFRNKLLSDGILKQLRKAYPDNYYELSIGKSDIHLSNKVLFNKNEIAVRLYVRNNLADEWYPFFYENKERIEREIGVKLNWDNKPGRRDKIISLIKKINLNEDKNIEEAIQWLADYTYKFYNTFGKLIEEKKDNH